MSSLQDLTAKVVAFRDAREWKQFHNPKDCALSLVLEAGELLEIFQWKNGDEIDATAVARRQDVADELADIFNWLLLIAHDQGIDLAQALTDKIAVNDRKYPADKAKGTSRKYTEL
ncbi:nucleotide pyrophosphohydrolase [Ramlibacter sp.]|uniref:nucleotide pyrophosphohydrolase n=1 Tax=Ramlibacter sp. TaxID=1917967 RepID=UPI003D10497C